MHFTRRSALTTSAALAIAPGAALLAVGSAPDPALAAFDEWRRAFIKSAEALHASRGPADDAATVPLVDASDAALDRLVRTRPTTLAGASALGLAAAWSLGIQIARPDGPHDPCAWRPAAFAIAEGTDEAAGFAALFSVIAAGDFAGQGGRA